MLSAINHALQTVFILMFFLAGCQTIRDFKSAVRGTAKPGGGISDTVPMSRAYAVPPENLRRATLSALQDQGYIAEENAAAGTVKTEPKPLAGTSRIVTTYSAKVYIKFERSTITYQARFDRKPALGTTVEQNVEYHEKENELRRDFFLAVDRKLATM